MPAALGVTPNECHENHLHFFINTESDPKWGQQGNPKAIFAGFAKSFGIVA